MNMEDKKAEQVNGDQLEQKSLKRKPVPTPRNTLKKPSVVKRVNIADDGQPNGHSSKLNGEQQAEKELLRTELDSNNDRKSRNLENEDILAALEKIPGVGNLRNTVNSNLANSLPSLNLEKVKREESSHSLSSSSGQFSLRSSEMESSSKDSTMNQVQKKVTLTPPSNTSNFQQRKLFHFNTERPRPRRQSSEDTTSSLSTKLSSPTSKTSTSESEDKEVFEKVHEDENEDEATQTSGEKRKFKIQSRPLPDLPEILSAEKTDEIHVISCTEKSNEVPLLSDAEREKNVYSALLEASESDHYMELNQNKSKAGSPYKCQELKKHRISSNGYLTLTGTMKKGRLKEVECHYDIQMNLSQEHLNNIEKKVHAKYHDRCFCGVQRGPHVFLLSVLSLPFLWIYATLWSFYVGTLTWYNIFIFFNEEKNCCWKLLSPLVLLCYPFWILPITILLGIFGALYQLSWYFDSWIVALRAPDGNFLHWFCNYMNLPDCSPYQVIWLSPSDILDRPGTGATLL